MIMVIPVFEYLDWNLLLSIELTLSRKICIESDDDELFGIIF